MQLTLSVKCRVDPGNSVHAANSVHLKELRFSHKLVFPYF